MKILERRVGTRHIKVLKEVPTGIALITVGENDNTIIVVPGANGQVDQIYADSIKEELKAFDMVVLQQEIPLETVHDLICFCAEMNQGDFKSGAGSERCLLISLRK